MALAPPKMVLAPNGFSYSFYANRPSGFLHSVSQGAKPQGLFQPFIIFPVPLPLSINTSAMMLTAISSGVSAFSSSPIGE